MGITFHDTHHLQRGVSPFCLEMGATLTNSETSPSPTLMLDKPQKLKWQYRRQNCELHRSHFRNSSTLDKYTINNFFACTDGLLRNSFKYRPVDGKMWEH
mmetsp:Transcript_7353/g.13289  ORF Transcript_7353/g.13289 Transcript_7353/m.13289 type:complete len:100 (+) Transcript_7353:4406-4705(+)